MAWSQADLDKIERAIADGAGVRSLAFSDQTVVFSSVDEMLRLRSTMAHEIAASSTPPKNIRYAVTDKGV